MLGDSYSYTADDIEDFCNYVEISGYHKLDLVYKFNDHDRFLCSKLIEQNQYWQIWGDERLAQLGPKAFLESLLSHFDEAAEGAGPKLILNFSHDTTLAIILQGLGLEVRANPPFASTIFFELWREEEGHSIRTLFNDEALTFGLCE